MPARSLCSPFCATVFKARYMSIHQITAPCLPQAMWKLRLALKASLPGSFPDCLSYSPGCLDRVHKLNNRNALSLSLEAELVPSGPEGGSGPGLSPGCWGLTGNLWRSLSCKCVTSADIRACVQIPSCNKDTSPIGLGAQPAPI